MYKLITATILASLLTACNPGDSFTEADQAICINIRNEAWNIMMFRGVNEVLGLSIDDLFDDIKQEYSGKEQIKMMDLAADAYAFNHYEDDDDNEEMFANATYLKCYNELK